MSNNIDSLFKKVFQENGNEPPDYIWDNIRKKLDARRKRKKIGIWWYSTVAGLLLLLSLSWLLARKELSVGLPSGNRMTVRNELPGYSPEKNKLALVLSSQPEFPVIKSSDKTPERKDLCAPAEIFVSTSGNAISAPLPCINIKQYTIRTGFIPLVNKESYTTRKLYRELLLAGTRQEPESVEQKRKISLSGHFAPGYASGNYTEPERVSRSNGVSDRMEGVFSLSGGVKIALSAGKRFSVQTGILYTRIGQQTQGEGVFIPKTNLLSASPLSSRQPLRSPLGNIRTHSNIGTVYYASNSMTSGTASLEQIFGALEIPLCLKYRLNDNKIKFSISGGFSGSFIVSNKAYMNSGNKREYLGTTENIRTFNISTDWALGVEYPVSSRITVLIEPGFRYYLQSLSKDRDIDFKPYLFSFSTGIGIDF